MQLSLYIESGALGRVAQWIFEGLERVKCYRFAGPEDR